MARRIALILALACLAAFAVSVAGLIGRIRAFNTDAGRTMFTFKVVNDRGFRYADRAVSLMDEEKDGQTVVVVRYGERELRLLATIPPGSAQLPGLVRHSDWLRVVRFTAYQRGDLREHLEKGNDRLAIVTRRPLTAPDPRTGQVWARDWLFEFHEFKPDGSVTSESLRYPRTKGDKDPRPGELRPNTWQMDAAMGMMPGSPPDSLNFGRPTAAFKDDALRNAGWTLPAAVVSALGLVACLAVLLGPRRAKGG
jgi:hypothetical protein